MSNEKKLITFCIPSYNSEPFLHYALDSLIPGGEEIEVLIIDDGSKDGTLEVAKKYEQAYPSIFKAIHQENAGHGGAINKALSFATGLYFKVLDSDDWVDKDSLLELLNFVREHQEDAPDLIVTDYVYFLEHLKALKRISFAGVIKKEREIISFSDVKTLPYQDNLTLHSAMYRLSVIKESGIILPEHYFYEDNFFVYAPMVHSKNLAYLSIPFYQYQIGRDGQSMARDTLISRYQMFVDLCQIIFDYYDITEIRKTDKGHFRLLIHHLRLAYSMMILVSRLANTKESNAAYKAMLKRNKKKNKALHYAAHRCLQGQTLGFPGFFGHAFCKTAFKITNQIVPVSLTEEKKAKKVKKIEKRENA